MSRPNSLVLDTVAPVYAPVKATPPRLLVIVAFLAVYIIWGSTYLGIRIAIDSIPPLLMAGTRFLMAGLTLYGVMRIRGILAPTRVHWRNAVLVGALLLLAGNGGMTWAEQTVPTNLAALMIAGTPLWIILIDWLRPNGTRPHGLVFCGILFGLTGVAVIIYGKNPIGKPMVDPFGALVVALSSICWATGSVVSRHLQKPQSALMGVAIQMIAGGILLLIAGAGLGEIGRFDFAEITMRSMQAFLYLTVFGSLVGFTSYVWLLQVSTPAKVSTYAYVNPMIAVLLGRLVLGEVLPKSALLAGALILTAVVLGTVPRRAKS